MNDKKYLDSILQNIHEGEAVQEGEFGAAVGISVMAMATFWLVGNVYKGLRAVADKHYAACVKKGRVPNKKCRLNSRIFMGEKTLELINKVGPSKCKTKKDPAKCMQKLKTDKVKLLKQLQYFRAQLSVIK